MTAVATRWRCSTEQRKRSARARTESGRMACSRGIGSGKMALAIRKIGVIGAGQMGSGIAHVCALSDYNVLLHDVAPDRIKAGLATIHGNMARQVGKNVITEDQRKAALKLISAAESLEALG